MANDVATKAAETAMQLPTVDTGSAMLSTTGYLLLILGVLLLAFWFLKRLGVSGGLSSPGGPKLVSRLMLGNRQSVAVVRYRDRDLVLGVTDTTVTLLKEEEALEEDVPATKGRTFASLLKRNQSDATGE